ncbi:MAG TPA: tRNA lysidine(34) synthetase TilS, partial [Nitriliruptorales bacterium]
DREALVGEVARALRPLPQGADVIVAVSGGPDSTALAYLTAEARPDLASTLAHVRHGLRDDARDVEVVRWHAQALAAPLHELAVTVRTGGEGLEAAARDRRYAALRRLAREVGAGWILVGHTADDQAETVLMRLARGTGLTGLGAMAPFHGDLVRPLLRLRRGDVHRFVLHEGLECVIDPMNRDTRFRRVRARLEVLPALERLGGDPVGALGRFADLARDDARFLDDAAAGLLADVVVAYGPARAVPAEVVARLEAPLARRVVRALILEVRGGDPPSAAQVEQVLALAPGQALEGSGVEVTTGGGWLAVAPAELAVPEAVRLAVPGRVRWAPTGADLVASAEGVSLTSQGQVQLALLLGERWQPPDLPAPPRSLPPGADRRFAQVALGGLADDPTALALDVRPREPGDRVCVPAGTRKLQDVFVDAGVPRVLRDLLPVVVAGERVLWVPGVVADAEALAHERPSLHLGLAPTGRPA